VIQPCALRIARGIFFGGFGVAERPARGLNLCAMGLSSRSLVSLLLILCLLVTGNALSSARGQGMAVGQMVICTGTGPVVVHVDAEGQPAEAPHYCPDCALTLIATGAGGVPGIVRPLATWQADAPHAPPQTVAQSRATLARARAPPLTV
jgi:hypothetical protein